MLWVPITLVATVAQTARNAAQSSLSHAVGTLGATQVRFVFGLPFACIFLALATWITGQAIPRPGLTTLGFTLAGSVSQIVATALMLVTMKSQNFAVTTAWLKTEPVLVALGSALILGDRLTAPILGCIALASAGVLMMTVRPGTRAWSDAGAALTGLSAAALFGAAAIGFRGGILALSSGDFLMRATTTLVLSLGVQTLLLLGWLALFNRPALTGPFRVWRISLLTGFLGAFASQFWFLGFSMTTAANVRTLSLVEVVFAQGISRRYLGQKASGRQVLGMVVVVIGVGLLLLVENG